MTRWRDLSRALALGVSPLVHTANQARSAWTLIVLAATIGGSALGQWLLHDWTSGLGVGLLALLAFVSASFGLAATRLVAERDRAAAQVLDLDFDSLDPTCHQEDWVDPAPRSWLGAERYRIRVTNITPRTIDMVTLSLVRFVPQGAPFLPMPLKVVGDDMGVRSEAQPLHGGERRYYEVASLGFDPDGRAKDHITLAYARSGVPNMILSGQRYELELRAQGRDTPAAVARFEVWVEDQRLRFATAGEPAADVRKRLKSERDQRFANELTKRRQLGIDILNRPVGSPQLLAAWKDASEAWRTNVLTVMRAHSCSEQEIASFEWLGEVQMTGHYDNDPPINHLKNVHMEQIRRLERVIDGYAGNPVFRR